MLACRGQNFAALAVCGRWSTKIKEYDLTPIPMPFLYGDILIPYTGAVSIHFKNACLQSWTCTYPASLPMHFPARLIQLYKAASDTLQTMFEAAELQLKPIRHCPGWTAQPTLLKDQKRFPKGTAV
jgi:hypothetical protein